MHQVGLFPTCWVDGISLTEQGNSGISMFVGWQFTTDSESMGQAEDAESTHLAHIVFYSVEIRTPTVWGIFQNTDHRWDTETQSESFC